MVVLWLIWWIYDFYKLVGLNTWLGFIVGSFCDYLFEPLLLGWFTCAVFSLDCRCLYVGLVGRGVVYCACLFWVHGIGLNCFGYFRFLDGLLYCLPVSFVGLFVFFGCLLLIELF